MIQKKSKPCINKLYTVQLYDADFKSLPKHLLGYYLMDHSELHGLHVHQLYGSRKDMTTCDTLLNTRVIYGINRVQRDYSISFVKELKVNYDRIHPALRIVTTCWMVLPKTTSIYHATSLKEIGHVLRNRFVISQGCISWDKNSNLQGIEQGNGSRLVS